MSIGLPRGSVKILPYDPEWAHDFEREKTLLQEALGSDLLQLEHVGSTSVPGLAAKPIIDMVAAVESFDKLDYFIQQLQKLGYEYMPERMFADRKFFPKGPHSNRTHHLNIVIKDDPQQWRSILAFRDALRKNKIVRDQYAALKQRLALEHTGDRAAYTQAKNNFIQEVLKQL